MSYVNFKTWGFNCCKLFKTMVDFLLVQLRLSARIYLSREFRHSYFTYIIGGWTTKAENCWRWSHTTFWSIKHHSRSSKHHPNVILFISSSYQIKQLTLRFDVEPLPLADRRLSNQQKPMEKHPFSFLCVHRRQSCWNLWSVIQAEHQWRQGSSQGPAPGSLSYVWPSKGRICWSLLMQEPVQTIPKAQQCHIELNTYGKKMYFKVNVN